MGRALQPKSRAAIPGAQVSMAAHVRAAVAQAAPAAPLPRLRGVVQRMAEPELSGDYAKVGNKLKKYAQWLYDKWEAKLIEGQRLGRSAPNLGVHAGRNANANDSAPARIDKADKALTQWYQGLSQSKSDRGLDEVKEEGEDEYVPSSSRVTYQRVDVDREGRRKEKKTARRVQYESGEKEPKYIPPWRGGPSAWHK